jgi:hypothetical protein
MYRLSEYYDFLKGLPKSLGIEKGKHLSAFRAKLDKCKDKSALICNRIKHNQNDLISVKCIAYDGEAVVNGYSLYGVNEAGVAVPSKDFHKKRPEALSFNLGLREDVCFLLLADFAAASMCRAVNPAKRTSDAAQPYEPDALIPQIRRVSGRSQIGMPLERSDMVWSVRLEFGSAAVGLQKRIVPSKLRGAEFEVQFSGDGYTRAYQLPDWETLGSAKNNPWKRPW